MNVSSMLNGLMCLCVICRKEKPTKLVLYGLYYVCVCLYPRSDFFFFSLFCYKIYFCVIVYFNL